MTNMRFMIRLVRLLLPKQFGIKINLFFVFLSGCSYLILSLFACIIATTLEFLNGCVWCTCITPAIHEYAFNFLLHFFKCCIYTELFHYLAARNLKSKKKLCNKKSPHSQKRSYILSHTPIILKNAYFINAQQQWTMHFQIACLPP